MKIDVGEYTENSNKKRDYNLSFKIFQNGKINDKQKIKFYRELRVLIESGVNIESALSIMIAQTKEVNYKKNLETIYDYLSKGKTLTYSLDKIGSFSSFEGNTIKIGEETSNLGKVLKELELFFDKKVKLKNQIITVLTYPIFVIIITISVLVFMLNSVVPMFEKIYRQFKGELPTITKRIIYISNNFSYFLSAVLLLLLLCALFYFRYKNTSKFRKISSSIIMRIPFFGNMVKSIYLARFCQSLSLLLSSKVLLIDSLEFVKNMIGFYPIESSIDAIKAEIVKGKTLGDSMSKHTVYDPTLVSMIKVSEEVNEVDQMFGYLTEQYNEEIERKSKRIGVLIEPFIIIVIGALVGVIMISMYLPMFNLSKILNSN